MKTINIKKNNQKYLKEILSIYPGIDSGRKNYKDQYKRVLKNILLSKAYDMSLKNNNTFPRNISFKENNNYLSIRFLK